jgi:HSP20 family protein
MASEQKNIPVSKGESDRPVVRMRPMEDIERAFEEFMRRPFMSPWRERLTELRLPFDAALPKLDVIDRDGEVLVRAELPGVKRDDIEISVIGNQLTLKGETKREEKEEKGDYYRCEMSHGSFWRSVTLPAEVSDTGAKAQLREGVLEVTLPKAEKAKKRPIKID